MATSAPNPGPPLPRPMPEPGLSDIVERLRRRLSGGRQQAVQLDAPDQDQPRAPSRFTTLATGLAMAAAVGGIILAITVSRGASGPPVETVLPSVSAEDVAPTTADLSTAEASPPVEVVVHVAGAVAAPGLVKVPADSRVADAIAAAGGPVITADTDRINLAALVVDSQRIYVPAQGEVVVPADTPGVPEEGDSGGLVDINVADAAALDSLPGVGPATAAAIVAHRDTHGPFLTIGALERVPGIGPAKLEQLRPLVVAGS